VILWNKDDENGANNRIVAGTVFIILMGTWGQHLIFRRKNRVLSPFSQMEGKLR